MASDVFFNRVAHTQRRRPPHDPASLQHHRSVGTSRSAGTLTFPPLYLDPVDPHAPQDNPATNSTAQHPGSFVLGSTFYHHPQLNALVSSHLVDAADAVDAASGTGHAFLTSIFASRDGGAHDDDSDAEAEVGGNGAEALAVPRPKISAEFVALNEDLVPASLDMHGDMLPADQHPSYPFGNLFGPLGGMIAADSAIVGGAHAGGAAAGALGGGLGDAAATLGLDFGGGLDAFIHLGHSSHGRRSAVSNAWNSFINKASRSKLVGSAGASTEWNLEPHNTTRTRAKDDTARPSPRDTLAAAHKLDLSPSLLFRTTTSTVLAPPTWPFGRHGPGCTSYAALLRPSSNIFGTSPASQAVAATLGGLPASSSILSEVWSDLALEELVPTQLGETSAVRHLSADEADDGDEADAGDRRGKKRARSDAEADAAFARRIATLEADPLDLLGPISREIRGHAALPWGTATSTASPPSHRKRPAYATQSDDEAAEAEHDDPAHGFAARDHVRYSFALPPAAYTWTDSPPDDDEDERTHTEPDGIGWSTAKRIFVAEQRDRLLAHVASRAGADGVEAYQVRGLRANHGLLPRARWAWADGAVDESGTALSASSSLHSDLDARPEEGADSVQQEEERRRRGGNTACTTGSCSARCCCSISVRWRVEKRRRRSSTIWTRSIRTAMMSSRLATRIPHRRKWHFSFQVLAPRH
ncbi:conserved hypothetical protein [Sporisorium reilianum SRZ2]|uniref:Uncharacterized protein n=1 Tax=Sporisorium reilianum (strain SRZ2) TaxID=999809 RepID=E7A386_SPORE|nr:conserved hypothetical protein [Sporisorium reilianum SRZ2]